MRVSRRAFVSTMGAAGAATAFPWIAARGMEGGTIGASSRLTPVSEARAGATPRRLEADLIRLDSNENPYGPASDAVDAIMRMFGEAPRYPDAAEEALTAAIARAHRVKPESVLLGCGSTELLKLITEACTSPTRPLVTAAPTFETPSTTAKRLGVPIRDIRVDASLRLDLQAMLDNAIGAGLVFLCNPNNPTGTLHSASDVKQFIQRLTTRAPESHILVDEAYFEYVDDPAYATAIPLALANPRVIVTRTFSKVYGMAGIRAGYAIAHPDTIRTLQPWRVASGINVFASAAAISSLELDEHLTRQQQLNREARTFAMSTMRDLGYRVTPSHTNFFITDIGRDPKVFQAEMRRRGVAVGRAFPPLDTHTRISIGTMDEMRRAMNVIGDVLARR